MAVAVVRGRTRSLVERFERQEKSYTNEDQATTTSSISNRAIPERRERLNSNEDQGTTISISSRVTLERGEDQSTTISMFGCAAPERRERLNSSEDQATTVVTCVIPETDRRAPPTRVNIYFR